MCKAYRRDPSCARSPVSGSFHAPQRGYGHGSCAVSAGLFETGFEPGSVLVRHLQNLLARVLTHHVRMIFDDMRLDVRHELVVGLALDILPTRTVHDLHVDLLDRG